MLSGPAAELRENELIRQAYLGELQCNDGKAPLPRFQGMRLGLASARPLLSAVVSCDRQ